MVRMLQRLFILTSFSFIVGLPFLVISCKDNENEIVYPECVESENILNEYADFHNFGLDYIKISTDNMSGVFSKSRLDSVFGEFVVSQYGKRDAVKVLYDVEPIKELILNGAMPTLHYAKSEDNEIFRNQANPCALAALNECLSKISTQLQSISDDEVFDNIYLLNKLQTIIKETYNLYEINCDSDEDVIALAQTLGVLYGSIEYWSNSENVEYWTNIRMDEDEGITSFTKYRSRAKEEQDKTLSKKDYIEVVAAADAIGGILGTPAAAVLASGAAALYFEVE